MYKNRIKLLDKGLVENLFENVEKSVIHTGYCLSAYINIHFLNS